MFGATIPGPIWANAVGPSLEALNAPKETFTDGTNDGLKTTTVDGKIRVPNVVGRSVSSATSALQAAGFQVSVASGRVQSSSVAAGLVASQSARSAAAGATITITRSSGAPPAPSPTPAGADADLGRPRHPAADDGPAVAAVPAAGARRSVIRT